MSWLISSRVSNKELSWTVVRNTHVRRKLPAVSLISGFTLETSPTQDIASSGIDPDLVGRVQPPSPKTFPRGELHLHLQEVRALLWDDPRKNPSPSSTSRDWEQVACRDQRSKNDKQLEKGNDRHRAITKFFGPAGKKSLLPQEIAAITKIC